MMEKKYTDVIIGGKVYTLGGYEDAEYMQKVASYLNAKLAQLNKEAAGFFRQASEFQNILLVLNTADDYFKAQEQAEESERKISDMEREIYDLKHELVTMQMKLENASKEASKWKEALEEQEKRLEELKESFFHKG